MGTRRSHGIMVHGKEEWKKINEVRYLPERGHDTRVLPGDVSISSYFGAPNGAFLGCLLRDQYFHFFSWLLAGNSYMVTLWWCLTHTLVYLLVTHPPLTILTWPLESRWLFTNTCSTLTVTWTSWVSSTSPLLIYSSAWLVPRHALLICLLS